MDNDEVQQWKQKYQQVVTELDDTQPIIQLLRKAIGRLMLLAQGQNDELDTKITQLKHQLHDTDTNQQHLSALIEQIEHTIISMEAQPAATDSEPEKPLSATTLLLVLLERLALFSSLTQRAKVLYKQIASHPQHIDPINIIDKVINMIDEIETQSLTEKQEYRLFLTSLTDRLHELDKQIHADGEDNNNAFQQRAELSNAFGQQMKDMQQDVNDADNLQQLKQAANQRLDRLNHYFEAYRQGDEYQFQQSQQQIVRLTQRIQVMEQESIKLHQSAQQAREQALHDSLTGAWNRQALNEKLAQEFELWQQTQQPLTIIIWDIDYFKRVNDRYGHAAGDKVLKAVSRIIASQTDQNGFVARYGGEEFMTIFTNTTLEQAQQLAEIIRKKIQAARFHYQQDTVSITTSAGLATCLEGDTTDSLFQRADQALYQAKGAGRNQCIAL